MMGCQHDIATPFPPGLEPFEDNPVPEQTPAEMLTEQSSDADYIHVWGRGYIFESPGMVWAATKTPTVMVASCSTDQQIITPDNDLTYESSFLVHYIVNSVLTVEWDDQWRYGTIMGTPDAPTLGMIKHQKTEGSSFIRLSEGTIQILATDDPAITELSFVEHLDSIGAGVDDVLKGVRHNYESILAASHGQPSPPCP
jgi:hypothetical protein